eukprot:gb/GFBE01076311.1/.p1 GENE.gb/GFBE01076311.1/~~gb/GFBE01076311.1/.p1  ORF type:complete len:343 (+),score=96.08 gb/GFBE01076311.1/:1-1029(+)
MSMSKSAEECTQWMQRVHDAHSKRSPAALAAALERAEQARQHEVSTRKCKAVKGHAVRSRALAAEGLRQMSALAPAAHMAVQERWKSAQEASSRRQEEMCSKMAVSAMAPMQEAALLRDAESEEEDAMAEVAGLVGAADVSSLAALGNEGLGASSGRGSSSNVDALLQQLRQEPPNETECAAKFMLYEGYASEVEQMRGTLFKFHEETRPTVPEAIAADMDKKVKGIDCAESMGIPDDARGWFVFHMMRQAERNNLKMAGILDGFEKKLEFLAANDQTECPVCLDKFQESGAHAAETLGCCHKVCKECWDSWSSVMHGRPFCPLCRHDEFLGTVAARVSATS